MKLVIIIPTYNEKENVPLITNEIIKTLKNINYNIVIIDDNSPDGTGEIAEELAKKDKHILVFHRESKAGIGGAYVEGFKFSLKNLNPDLLLTMDADLSHNPKYIPEIYKAAKDYDIVIGSRYVKSGGVQNWNILRRIISKGANLLAKTILGLKSNDCTSGFKCFKRKVIESIDFDKISSKGYSFIIEMLYICKKKGFTVKEVPIIFTDRNFGQSKISKKEMFNTLKLLIKLRFFKNSN